MRSEGVAAGLRAATPADAAAIAALHARSWRATYRGLYDDDYLDGPVTDERDRAWRERLGSPDAKRVTLVMQGEGSGLVGFVCGLMDHDPQWGTLIDNLHVAPDHKGSGLGRRLLHAFADRLVMTSDTRPVHLFVLARNAGALAFYARMRGLVVQDLTQTEPDGRSHPVHRIAWPNAAALSEGAA